MILYQSKHFCSTRFDRIQIKPATRAPLGDRVIISDSEIAVRSLAHIHPALIVLLLIYAILSLLEIVAVAVLLLEPVIDAIKEKAAAGSSDYYPFPVTHSIPDVTVPLLGLITLVLSAGLILIIVYGFLAGESQFIIHKNQLPATRRIDPQWDRTDTWLDLEKPKSLRTRLVVSSTPSPLVGLLLILNLPRLLPWLRQDAYALEVFRRLGKLTGIDRMGLRSS